MPLFPRHRVFPRRDHQTCVTRRRGGIRPTGVVGPVSVDLFDVALHLVEQPLENLAVLPVSAVVTSTPTMSNV